MTQPTMRQRDVLFFIARQIRDRKLPPSFREIAEHFGWGSTTAVKFHVRYLMNKGLLVKAARVGRWHGPCRTLSLTEAGWNLFGWNPRTDRRTYDHSIRTVPVNTGRYCKDCGAHTFLPASNPPLPCVICKVDKECAA